MIQATSLPTFAVALTVFGALGYPDPVTLAAIAGLLQFLPGVGPSGLVVALRAYEVSVGEFAMATLILVVGQAFITFFPDAVLCPRLAHEAAKLPSSLYFGGFTGGIVSVGPVGIIAGPLVAVLFVETLSLLVRDEVPCPPVPGANPEHPRPSRTADAEPPTE